MRKVTFIFMLICLPLSIYAGNFVNRTEEANNDLKASFSLSKPPLSYLKKLLANERFDKLEEIFTELEEKYKEDPLYESPLLRGLEQFDPENDVSEAHLNKWVEEKKSAIAYAARGIYLAQKAAQARGSKYIQDTPQSAIDLMRKYSEYAFTDLLEATTLDPMLTPAYCWMLVLVRFGGDIETGEYILRRALSYDSRTLYVRLTFMDALRPRWGGSFELMKLFAEESVQFVHLNPRLWSLLGEVDYEKGRICWEQKQYKEAIEYFTTALSFGEKPSILKTRAGCYYSLGEYENALEDFNRALYYTPNDEVAVKWSFITDMEMKKQNKK